MSDLELATAFRDLARDLYIDLHAERRRSGHVSPERLEAHADRFRSLSFAYLGTPLVPYRRRSFWRWLLGIR